MNAVTEHEEPQAANLQPVLADAHREKTRDDVRTKAKIARVRKKHLGLDSPKRKMAYRRFNGEVVYPDRKAKT